MTLGITRDHWGSLGMIPDDPGCTWVISGNFQNFMIFMNFPSVPRRRVLRTPSPYAIGSAPSSPNESFSTWFPKMFDDLSIGYYPVPHEDRNPWATTLFSEHVENVEKSMNRKWCEALSSGGQTLKRQGSSTMCSR